MGALRFSISLVFILSAGVVAVPAQVCAPPPGFVDIPHPAIANAEELVSHTEEVTINRPLAAVLHGSSRPLKDIIHKSDSLPGVTGEHMLVQDTFGTPGSRRLTCLTDGSTLEEEVLQREQTSNSYHFRYVVWNYTSETARPIVYGVGDFHDTDLGDGRTHVVWTYSFMLNRERFPGELGSFGQFLFRVGFLDRQYADMMRATLNGTKANVER
ncbi:hypothetical protein EDE15_0460 [Edaphobacter aggregans]|uniref:Polyketide cyclase/dehydrase/lipid transport protein n=1 Tax=Edaphobacter aggregans TaxID=570835 RepID=A0A428MDN4_9BACT|nr:hypothetical protein [Edaphobacter aggregans]RSL14990.1 hypothetical protein EDE15_0460 [Edaphobacter aggregans]